MPLLVEFRTLLVKSLTQQVGCWYSPVDKAAFLGIFALPVDNSGRPQRGSATDSRLSRQEKLVVKPERDFTSRSWKAGRCGTLPASPGTLRGALRIAHGAAGESSR